MPGARDCEGLSTHLQPRAHLAPGHLRGPTLTTNLCRASRRPAGRAPHATLGTGSHGHPLEVLAEGRGGPQVHPAAACSPLWPALVRELEPGLNLSALGSCPDTLPRGLGHSVPVPPAAARPAPRAAPALADRPPGREVVPGRGHSTPGSGPWGGLRQPRPFGHCGLEAWLPSVPLGQPSRLPAHLCPAGHTGVPRGLLGPGAQGRQPGIGMAIMSTVDRYLGGDGRAAAGLRQPPSLPGRLAARTLSGCQRG